ncbi:MAG: PD-(D/E)XK nuclease family protein, partial [Armatimonadota bacterium]|nr:PD-(D/E)XK nuclease family protein [Armatimonadota bacterium]
SPLLPGEGLGVRFSDPILAQEADRRALSIGFARLRRWRDALRVRPLSEVLEMVLRESEIAFYDAGAPDAEQRAENWRKLLEILRDREQRGQGSVRDLAEFLMAQADEEERESEAALPASGAIQLMTIYAAKGLGFPMVIVGQMDDTPAHSTETLKRGAFPTRDRVHFCLKIDDAESSDDHQKSREPLLWTILKEQARAQEEAEFRRLLYVACTRAKDHLLFVLPENHKPDSWADMVLPFVLDKPIIRYEEKRAAAIETAAPVTIPELPRFDEALLRPLAADAPSDEVSVTELVQGFIDVASGASSTDVEACGRIVHRLLELGPGSAHRQTQAHNLVLSYGLSETTVPTILRQVEQAEAWLSEQGFDLQRARHEVPFSVAAEKLIHLLPERYQGVQWVNGVIDLLVPLSPDPADGWALIDFKTHAADAQPESLIERWRYDHQLRLYAAAAMALGLPIRRCWMLFLSESGDVTPVRIETETLPEKQSATPAVDLSEPQLRFLF